MSGETLDSAGASAHLLGSLERENTITANIRGMIERFMQKWQVSAFHALLMTELLTEAELANALANAHGLPRIYHVRGSTIAEGAAVALPFRRAREWECLLVQVGGDGSVKPELVLADPTRTDRINEVRQKYPGELTLAVAERSDILKAIDELYPLSEQLPSLYGK